MKELIRCDVTFLLLVISVELLVGASVGVVRPLHLPAAPMLNLLNIIHRLQIQIQYLPVCSPHLCGLLAVPDLLHGGELHLGDGRARPAPDVGHQILGRPAVTSHLMLTLLNIYLLLYAVNGTVERRPHFIIKFRKFLLVDSSNVIVPT